MRRGSTIFGFGGPRLAAAGAELVGDFTGFSVTGLTEAVRVHPAVRMRCTGVLVAAARERRPDVFVAIDFPDFNFRLMAALRRLGIPVVYYVSPQLWAWRPGRMKTMKRFVEQVLVIFPFEAAALPARGHARCGSSDIRSSIWREPAVARRVSRRTAVLLPDAPTVALLPGQPPE